MTLQTLCDGECCKSAGSCLRVTTNDRAEVKVVLSGKRQSQLQLSHPMRKCALYITTEPASR